MSTIGYFNYYNKPGRYSPAKVEDRYQQMVDKYNSGELQANGEDPYSEENLAIRKLDERLASYAASVRSQCASEHEVHTYLSKKYFGTSDFAYTKKWDDPETYAMFENDYKAICYGTVGGANPNDPRLKGKTLYGGDENTSRMERQKVISHQFSNLLAENGIYLNDDSTFLFSFHPYSYQSCVSNDKNSELAAFIEKLINTKDNSRQLFTYGLYNSNNIDSNSLAKWRAYHNVMKYTGLDMSTLQASDGKYYSDDGKELMEMIREGISKDTSIGPQFKGAAFDYISEQISMVMKKGWNNIPDINMNIAYARNTGFYLVN